MTLYPTEKNKITQHFSPKPGTRKHYYNKFNKIQQQDFDTQLSNLKDYLNYFVTPGCNKSVIAKRFTRGKLSVKAFEALFSPSTKYLESMIELRFNPEQILYVTTQDGATETLKALHEHKQELLDRGFSSNVDIDILLALKDKDSLGCYSFTIS